LSDMSRKQLRKSEVREINDVILDSFGRENFLGKKDKIEIQSEEFRLILVNEIPYFFYVDDVIIPTLKLCLKDCFLKRITVDMGAVKFVTGGADVMRPGIVAIDPDIKGGEFVACIDEKNRMPLAVCKAMFPGDEIESMSSGKVLENIHYVGDKLWKL